MESVFSDELFSFTKTSEDMAHTLAGEFSHLPSTLRDLERSVGLNSDIRIRQLYRSLRLRLLHGVCKTLDFLDLLRDILWITQDQERWGRTEKELGNAARSAGYPGAVIDKMSTCLHLLDLDN